MASYKDAFRTIGQALGGAIAVGAQSALTPKRRPMMTPMGKPQSNAGGAPRCTPCRAHAMVAAAQKFGSGKR